MQVPDPLEVVDLAVRVHVVLGGAAVLGDVQGQARRILGQTHQQFVEALGVDQPAHRRPLEARRGVLDDAGQVPAGHLLLAAAQVRGVARAHKHRCVVVDPEEVDGLRDDLQVARSYHRVRRQQRVPGLRRVPPVQHGVQVEAVHLGVPDPGRLHNRVREGPAQPHRVHVQCYPDGHGPRQHRPQRLRRKPVTEEQVVRGRPRGLWVAYARGVLPRSVAVAGDYLRFVQRDPPLDPVAERPGHDRRVVSEPRGGVPDRPAALILEFLRQVPVKERGCGGDATVPKLVQQRLVVVEALLVHRAPAAREDPRP